MLSKSHPLFFPKLERIGTFDLVRKDAPTDQKIDGFRLNWDNQEEMIKNKHEEWKNKYHPDKKLPFVGALPEEWNKWIKRFTFALNHDYFSEIKYWSQAALDCWNRPYLGSFDTVVREECLSPGIEMIRTAFFLICDCIYDKETRYWDRNHKNSLARYIMSYKFWSYQTGRGLLERNAGLDNLEWSLKHSTTAKKHPKDVYIVEGKKWLKDIRKHQEKLNASYDELAILCNDGNMQGKQAK